LRSATNCAPTLTQAVSHKQKLQMIRIQIFLIGALLLSCSSQPDWVKDDMDFAELIFDSIYLDRLFFDNHPFVISNEQILSNHGEPHPDGMVTGYLPDSLCDIEPDPKTKLTIPVRTVDYNGFRFIPIDSRFMLFDIDFTKTDKVIIYDGFELSNKTKLSSIKHRFSNSYYSRCHAPDYVIGIPNFDGYWEANFDIKTADRISKRGYDLIYLNMVGRKCYPFIELVFLENRLIYLSILG
jgi:hypothetical protein